MYLRHNLLLLILLMYVIRLTSLMSMVFVNFIFSIQKLLAILQIHNHLLLLIMCILFTLIWTWLRIKFTLSVEVSLSCYFTKMTYFTCMIRSQTAGLMLYTHLILLFLTMLTMCTIGRSTMHISCGLLIPITLVYRDVINILLISILTLNNIIIINMLIFIQCLLLSAVMGIIYFIGNFGVCSVHIHLIRRLNHINSILMI